MTDDDFDKVDEDFTSEFDFVDTDQSANPAPGNAPQNTPPPNITQTIISLVVLVAIVAGSYYAYRYFFGSKSETTTATEKPAETPLPEPAEAPMPTLMPEAGSEDGIDFSDMRPEELSNALPAKTFAQVQQDMQKQKQASGVMPAEIQTVLQSINEEMTTNVNNFKQLETTITALTATVDQLNKAVSAMDNRVLGLTETVDALSQDLANVKKVMVDEDMDLASPGTIKFTNKKTAQPINASSTSYTVHAIIPGRAWLKSSSGQIITVTEGDKIGDYGTVAAIDSANGIVRTSSGIILK